MIIDEIMALTGRNRHMSSLLAVRYLVKDTSYTYDQVSEITGIKQRAKNGDLYYNFTMRIEDETGKFGNNAGMWDQQTKEERDAKTERHYTGNAKVVWTDGKVSVAVKQEQESNDLPF